MTSEAAILSRSGFREVAAGELATVSGGWFGCFYLALARQMEAQSQETKLMNFLGSNVSPK